MKISKTKGLVFGAVISSLFFIGCSDDAVNNLPLTPQTEPEFKYNCSISVSGDNASDVVEVKVQSNDADLIAELQHQYEHSKLIVLDEAEAKELGLDQALKTNNSVETEPQEASQMSKPDEKSTVVSFNFEKLFELDSNRKVCLGFERTDSKGSVLAKSNNGRKDNVRAGVWYTYSPRANYLVYFKNYYGSIYWQTSYFRNPFYRHFSTKTNLVSGRVNQQSGNFGSNRVIADLNGGATGYYVGSMYAYFNW